MTLIAINRMTDDQLQIAIDAKALNIAGIQNILSEHVTLPKGQIAELWNKLQTEVKLLDGLKRRQEETAQR